MGVGAGLYMYVVVVQKFTFAISSPDEFFYWSASGQTDTETCWSQYVAPFPGRGKV